MKSIINKIVLIIYIGLLVLIYLLFLKNNLLLSSILGILSIALIYIFCKLNKKYNFINKILENKIIIISLILLAILLRFSLLMFDYNEVYSDEATFYYNAVSLASNLEINSKYIAVFPYLFGYINILSMFMKVFGTTIYHAITFNIIVDLIGAVFAYLLGKKIFNDKKKGILFLVIWLFNPFNIIWCMKILPINIVNTMITISAYVFECLLSSFNNKRYLIISIILGIIIGISNSFRPIMIIFLIAIFLYYLYLIIFSKYNFKKLLLSFVLIVLCYSVYNNLNYKLVQDATGYTPSKSGSGWSVYVGSNINSNGEWFLEPKLDEFFAKDEDFSPSQMHEYFMKERIKNYKSYNLITLSKFMIKKLEVLANDVYSYTYDNFTSSVINQSKKYNTVFKVYLYCFWFLMFIINIFSIFNITDKNENSRLVFYRMFFIGLVASHLLVEVSPRYFMPMLVLLIILMGFQIEKLMKKENVND